MYCYQCTICGHIYNPDLGEKSQAIERGVDFLLLPPDWACPVCLAGKAQFKKCI
jgi:rubredoxin